MKIVYSQEMIERRERVATANDQLQRDYWELTKDGFAQLIAIFAQWFAAADADKTTKAADKKKLLYSEWKAELHDRMHFHESVVSGAIMSAYRYVLNRIPLSDIEAQVLSLMEVRADNGKRNNAFSVMKKLYDGFRAEADADADGEADADADGEADAAKAAKVADAKRKRTRKAKADADAKADGEAAKADDPLSRCIEALRRESGLYLGTPKADATWLLTTIDTCTRTINGRREMLDAQRGEAADAAKASANKADAAKRKAEADADAAKAEALPSATKADAYAAKAADAALAAKRKADISAYLAAMAKRDAAKAEADAAKVAADAKVAAMCGEADATDAKRTAKDKRHAAYKRSARGKRNAAKVAAKAAKRNAA